jgi:hypothetical protein
MIKTGRNDSCPCGSGKKFKHCCLQHRQAGRPLNPVSNAKVSLLAEVERIQQDALRRQEKIRQLGVFVLYASSQGDAWLFEITDSDAVQLARAGEVLATPIDENPDTIEIDWSHHYAIEARQLLLTPYRDAEEVRFDQRTTHQLSAAMRRIRKKCSPALLKQVHVNLPPADEAPTAATI